MKFLTWAYWKLTGDIDQRVLQAYKKGFRDGVAKADADYQPLLEQLTVATKRIHEMEQKITTVNSLLDAFKGTRPT